MGIDAFISDGDGHGNVAGVTEDSQLRVAVETGPPPAFGEPNKYRYYTSLLGTTGADSGTLDMATTADSYYIGAQTNADIRVMMIVVLIGDAGSTHNDWGNLGALSTGCDLCLSQQGVDQIILDKAKTHGQALMQTGLFGYHSGGSNAGSFTLTNYTGTADAQSVVIPVGDIVPGGLRIGKGSTDRLTFTANDDLSGLENQTVRVIGFTHHS